MKNLKKILAWVLLVCMVLTLASCKKVEDKVSGGSEGEKTDADVKTRLFMGEIESEYGEYQTIWCTATGNSYQIEMVMKDASEQKMYKKNSDGSYLLEGFFEDSDWLYDGKSDEYVESIISIPTTAWLQKGITGYYNITETADPEHMQEARACVVDLRSEGTYVKYPRLCLNYSYGEEVGRKIFRSDKDGIPAEMWKEGEAITVYVRLEGTYAVKERGDVRKLVLSWGPASAGVIWGRFGEEWRETLQAMQKNDTLTLSAVDAEPLTMTRMDAKRYSYVSQDEEYIFEICDDRSFAVLISAGEVTGKDYDIECISGKKLQLTIEGDEYVCFDIGGDKLTISMNDTEIVLTEVK